MAATKPTADREMLQLQELQQAMRPLDELLARLRESGDREMLAELLRAMMPLDNLLLRLLLREMLQEEGGGRCREISPLW